MKAYKYFTLSAAFFAAMYSCSTLDEEIPPMPEDTANSTVQMANNTSVKVGSAASLDQFREGTRAMKVFGAATPEGNNASSLSMPENIAMPDGTKSVTEYSDFGWNSGRDYPVNIDTDGQTYGFPLAADVFVSGKTTVNNMWTVYGRDSVEVIVNPGGELAFTMSTLTGVIVNNGGKLTVTSENFTINHGSAIYVDGDFETPGDLNVVGDLYVSGNLTVNGKLDVNNGAKVYVGGDVVINGNGDNTVTNNGHMAVQGALNAKKFNLDSNSNLWVGCSVELETILTLHNNSVLTVNYLQVPEVEISATTLNFVDKGVLKTDLFNVGDVNGFSVNTGGSALISAGEIKIGEQYSFVSAAENIDGDLYINTQNVTVGVNGVEETHPGADFEADGTSKTNDAQHTINLMTTKVNAATLKTREDGECAPTFTKKDGEAPQDVVVNKGDSIILVIPTEIEREWFIEADDFAVRINGEYQASVLPVGNEVTLNGVKINEKNLTVTVDNVSQLDQADTDYTYELWLWVAPTSWAAMTDEEKAPWLAPDGNTDLEPGETMGQGTDISALCSVVKPEGYSVRTNVFQGTNGNNGDTHYIKVSIHIMKE